MSELTGTSRRRGRHLIGLLVALVLALLVRVIVIERAENIAQDGAVYLQMARAFTESPSAQVFRDYQYHPAYPAVVAAVARLVGADFPGGFIAVGHYVSVVAGMVALVGLYFIARMTFDRRIALIAVALMGVSPAFTRHSSDVLSDALAVAMAMLAVASGLFARRLLTAGSAWSVALAGGAGLAGGLGYLARPEELLTAFIALCLLVIRPRSGRGAALMVLSAAALVIMTLACVLPYASVIGSLTQKKSLDDFMLSEGRFPLAMGQLSVATPWLAKTFFAVVRSLDKARVAMGTTVCALAGICFLTWIGRYVLRVRLPRSVIIKPTGAGAFAMFSATVVMVPIVSALEFQHGPAYVSNRHMLMAAMLLSPAAGAGVVILAEWMLVIAGALGIRKIPSLALGLCLLFVLGPMAAFTGRRVMHKGKGAYREAGLFIHRRYGPGELMLAPEGTVALYAGAPAEQSIVDSKVHLGLHPRNLWSMAHLRRCLRRSRPRTYAFLVVSNGMVDFKPNRDTFEKMLHDDAFEQVAVCDSSDPRHVVYVFRLNPNRAPRTRTRPAGSGKRP